MTDHLTTDQVALMNLRADCLNFAEDLSDLSHALRRIAAGRAERGDVALVRGLITSAGDLEQRIALDWETLLRAARSALHREPEGG